jgi:serine/threonine-protein kinase
MREARTAGMCGHPNVAVVYDAGTLEDGRPYLVMERLYGQSLAARIAEGRPMSPEDAIDVAVQVLSALDAVHRAGVVHRDVKPDNVFLVDRTAEGAKPRPGHAPFVKVLDFGTSKPMSGPERDLTGTGIAIGTAFYMSPEQARGERDLDGRVDVYACGVMLYEMLTGARPFTAASEHAVLLKILGERPAPLASLRPSVPPELDAIIQKAMARDRAERYATAEEFIGALESLKPMLFEAASSSRARPLPPAAPLPDSVRVPMVRGMPPPPSSRTAVGFEDEETPDYRKDSGNIRALARAAVEGAEALRARTASAPVSVVRGTASPPSEPTMPIPSKDARALAAESKEDPGSPAPPRAHSPPSVSNTAPTRRVDPPSAAERDSDHETTRVVPPRGRS